MFSRLCWRDEPASPKKHRVGTLSPAVLGRAVGFAIQIETRISLIFTDSVCAWPSGSFGDRNVPAPLAKQSLGRLGQPSLPAKNGRSRSRDEGGDGVGGDDAGQALIQAAVVVGQLFVIQAHEVEDGGV